MPRTSKRYRYLKEMKDILRIRLIRNAFRSLHDEEDSLEDAKDVAVAFSYSSAKKKRYLFRSRKYRKGGDRFEDDFLNVEVEREETAADAEERSNIEEEASKLPWLTEDEFLHKYRTTRRSFSLILDEIKDHAIFKAKQKQGGKQAPVVNQLMVFLKYLGSEGSAGSNRNQRHVFSIGSGTALLYRKRVTRAIMSLRDKYYFWPKEEERKQIALAIHEKYNFPHCVGIADGTLFPLAFEPQSDDAPDFSGRKYGYSFTTMIVCDHTRRIRYYLSGFPGSVHDNRVWKNTDLKISPVEFFNERQYVVGDSAFENDTMIVSAFKKMANCNLSDDQEFFNGKLSKLRIVSEHCIGMLKGRFPWLRSIRMQVRDKVSIRKILQLLDATIIVHNMLIEFGEEDPPDWIDYDDFSDIAMQSPYQEEDELNVPIPVWAPKDARRTQLLNYFKEFFSF
jgi:hypothetical protein